jgi:hypothetical protein
MFALGSVLRLKKGNYPMITDGKSLSSVIHATTPLNSNPLTLTPTKDFAVSNVSRKPCRATKERNTHLYSQLSMKILMA